jgi:hypothetical protein
MNNLRRIVGGIALLLLTVASVHPARAQQVSGFPRTVVIDSIEYRAEIERVKAGEVTKGRHPFRARVDGYMVYLIATNRSNRPVRRELARDCMLVLGLHRVGRGHTRPVYDPHRGGCDLDAVLLQLEPGESERRWNKGIFPRSIPIPRDSLPNGEYIVTARVRATSSRQQAPREIYVARIQLVRPNAPRSRRSG